VLFNRNLRPYWIWVGGLVPCWVNKKPNLGIWKKIKNKEQPFLSLCSCKNQLGFRLLKIKSRRVLSRGVDTNTRSHTRRGFGSKGFHMSKLHVGLS
jgi:hypothetical protein